MKKSKWCEKWCLYTVCTQTELCELSHSRLSYATLWNLWPYMEFIGSCMQKTKKKQDMLMYYVEESVIYRISY